MLPLNHEGESFFLKEKKYNFCNIYLEKHTSSVKVELVQHLRRPGDGEETLAAGRWELQPRDANIIETQEQDHVGVCDLALKPTF